MKQFGGTVRPPKDLKGAALKTLGQKRYEEFIKKFGENFTPQELVKFHEAK